MKIIKGNIWKVHEEGAYIGIPTNGIIKTNGNLVMGRGLALQASEHFPELPKKFGQHVNNYGNTVCLLRDYKLFSFPTKNHWTDFSDLFLIEQSAQTLSDYFAGDMFEFGLKIPEIYLPKVGCGLGELNWKQVEPILHAYLNDIVTIIDWR